jgi:SAM-dependent methyltransferase
MSVCAPERRGPAEGRAAFSSHFRRPGGGETPPLQSAIRPDHHQGRPAMETAETAEASDFRYSGSALLLAGERALKNYNTWIVSQFVRQYAALQATSVLDFGAGTGSLCVIFRKMTGVTPATLEIDRRQREILKTRGFDPFATIDDIPGRFDLIYTSNVLEHIEDDVDALKRLRDKLTPDGRIAIFVPAFNAIWTTLDDKVGHCRRYTKATLRAHLEAAGFTVEEMRYCDSIGFLLAALFKLIGSKSGEPSEFALTVFDRVLWPVSRAVDAVNPFFGKNVLAVARPNAS